MNRNFIKYHKNSIKNAVKTVADPLMFIENKF